MFQVNVESGDLPNLSDKLNPPAVVQSISRDDLSISYSLRASGNNDLASIEQGLREYLSFECARGLATADFSEAAEILERVRLYIGKEWTSVLQIDHPQGAQEVVLGSVVGGLLVNIGKTLENPELQARYSSGELSEREQLEVLRYASSENRLGFLRDLRAMSAANQEVAAFVTHRLDNAFYYLSTAEKTAFTAEISASLVTPRDCGFLAAALRNASDFGELSKMVAACGADRLMASNNAELRECVAEVVLGGKIRELTLPRDVKTGEALDALTRLFCQVENMCMDTPEFSGTETAQRFLMAAAYNLSYLKTDRAYLEWAGNSDKELRELADVLMKKCELETRFGILLTHEEFNGVEMSLGRRWRQNDLADIEKVLDKIGEGRVLLTPMLYEIRRVSDLGENIMGVRFPDGRVAIADLAVDNFSFAAQYGGPSSLELVLTHELGHSSQLGIFYGHVQFDPAKGWCIDEGDPSYEFSEYMKLSGWRMIDPSKVLFTDDGPFVLVEGNLLQLETPVSLDGESVVLVRSGNLLLAYAAEADFSSRWYSKVNPWEDFAEAFMEYFWAPEKLMISAPDKFQFLEQELHFYESNPDLLKTLTSAQTSGQAKSV